MGIEPTLSAWEADALPLSYTRKAQRDYIMNPIIQHYYSNITTAFCQCRKMPLTRRFFDVARYAHARYARLHQSARNARAVSYCIKAVYACFKAAVHVHFA